MKETHDTKLLKRHAIGNQSRYAVMKHFSESKGDSVIEFHHDDANHVCSQRLRPLRSVASEMTFALMSRAESSNQAQRMIEKNIAEFTADSIGKLGLLLFIYTIMFYL
jgi:hypothetical protein